jgi:phage head maturation protease
MTIRTQQVTPLSRAAAVGSANADKRTVDVVFSTGAKVLRSSWMDGPFYEELDMSADAVRLDRLNNGAPFLMDHNGYSVANTPAVVESARVEGGKGFATVRFAKAGVDPAADMLFAKIQDGIVRSVSVGYRVHKIEKIVTEGEKVPTMRVVDWTPYEISAVAMPADAGAGFRHADQSTNEVEITHRGASSTTTKEQNRMDPEELKKQEEAKAQAEIAKRSAEIEAETAKRVQQLRERDAGIQHACRTAKLGDEFAQKLIGDAKIDLNAARALVLEELAKRSDDIKTEPARVEVTDDASDKFQRGAMAWLIERGNAASVVAEAKAKGVKGLEKVETDGGEFRGMTLVDLARESLERRGVKTRGMDRMTMVGRALTHRAGYATTGDFPVLLENTMNKVLLGQYAVTPDTWSLMCKQEDVPDFRTQPRYSTGALGSLDELTELGEFKNKTISDGLKKTIQTGTKGNIYAISRKLIINDDMGFLTSLATAIGRGARLGIEEDFYALLAENSGLGPTQTDAQPFFHSANRGNVNGTGAAISVAGIDADRQIFLAMRDQNSKEYLQMTPAILLVSSANGAAARSVNTDTFDHDSTKLQKRNTVAGLFRQVVDTPRFTGNRRYLFADPNIAAAVVVAFLEGQGRSPVMETEAGWRVDGTEMKVRFDYEVQMFDPKGAITNAGQ